MTIAPNWRSGTTMTLEEYRRHAEPVPPPPARGSRLTELAAALGDRPGWQEKAACRGKPTSWWFPASGANLNAQKAVAICATCPVVEPCRKAGIENNERGIWGDTTGQQRVQIRSSNTRSRETKLGPLTTRVLELIADGRWHSYDDLVDGCAELITPEVAMRSVTKERHRRARSMGRADRPVISFTKSSVTAGRRLVIATSVNTLAKAGRVERDRGAVRLVKR